MQIEHDGFTVLAAYEEIAFDFTLVFAAESVGFSIANVNIES